MSGNKQLLQFCAPSKAGISSQAVLKFLKKLNDSGEDHHSVMCAVGNKVFLNAGFSPYNTKDKHMMFSMSKAFLSTAVGLACDRNEMSVEDNVSKYFPEIEMGEASETLKIKHLLTMTTGQEREELFTLNNFPSWAHAFASVPFTKKTGEFFMYNTVASYMLGDALKRACGMTFTEYLYKHLSDINFPLLCSDGDPNGDPCGGWGIYASCQDIMMLGQLYLNGGNINGKQLLSREWINTASSHAVNSTGGSIDWTLGYGYMLWQCSHNMYRGDGSFSQYMVINPARGLVFSATSGIADMQGFLTKILDFLNDDNLFLNQNNYVYKGSDIAQVDSYNSLVKSDNNLLEYVTGLKKSAAEGEPGSEFLRDILGKTIEIGNNKYNFKSIKLQQSAKNNLVVSINVANNTYEFACGNKNYIANKSNLPLIDYPFLCFSAFKPKESLNIITHASYGAKKDSVNIIMRHNLSPATDLLSLTKTTDGLQFIFQPSVSFEWLSRSPISCKIID